MQLTNFYLVPVSACVVTGLTMAAESDAPSISGSVTATAQTTSDDRVDDEIQGSADLAGELPLGPGSLNIHVEGSTTTSNDGIAALIGEANGDAGSALDDQGRGRLQVSELFYTLNLNEATLNMGLLDPTSNLDTDAIANDENVQFLAGTLVNNPTIEFPDYTLGVSLDAEPETAGMGYHIFVGSSHGLGDNTERDYADLFQLDADHKGVFTAAEGVLKAADLTVRLGMWWNSSDHAKLEDLQIGNDNDTIHDTTHNWGLYGSLNGAIGSGNWSLRSGWADPTVSEAAWSLGAALEYPVYTATTAGLGVVHTAASDDLGPNVDDNLLAELYLRFDIDTHLQITPILQYVRNPGFDNTEEVIDQDQWLAGLRLHVPF